MLLIMGVVAVLRDQWHLAEEGLHQEVTMLVEVEPRGKAAIQIEEVPFHNLIMRALELGKEVAT